MIAAVILAAGGSSRMGRPKQLLAYRGRSLLRSAVDAALDGGCSSVMVVTGSDAGLVRAELEGLPVEIVVNEEWREGLAGSIRCGIAALGALEEQPSAALLLACDQPLLSGEVVGGLCALFDGERGRMVACEYAGTVGVPALFERSCFDRLMALVGDSGAKRVLLSDLGMLLRHPWPDGAKDVDRPSDLDRLG